MRIIYGINLVCQGHKDFGGLAEPQNDGNDYGFWSPELIPCLVWSPELIPRLVWSPEFIPPDTE